MNEERDQASTAATKAILVFLSVVMLGIIAGTGVLLYHLTWRATGKTAAQVDKCDEGKAGTCLEGEICVHGQCTAWEDPPKCEIGKPCDPRCSCPYACRSGLCVQPVASSAACALPEVQDALRRLVVACEHAGGRGIGCEPSKWQDFVMHDARFDEIITNFPDKVTIHFPAAKPEVVASWSDWPSAAVKAHYVEQMRRMRPALDAAKLIFVVGRASKGGAPEQNTRLGFARMQFARSLMQEVYKDSDTGRDALDRKVLNFTLGESRQLPAGFFESRLEGKMITWDDGSQARLANAVMNPTAITQADKWWAVNVVNQVAFVIAVPCDGGDMAK